VLIYTAILWLIIIGLLVSLWFRTSFRVDVVRDRGVMARVTDDGMLENVYRLQIMNATENTQHYRLNVSGLKNLEIEAENAKEGEDIKDEEHIRTIAVKPAESRWLNVDLKVPDGSVESGSHKIEFEIQALESKEIVKEKSIFLAPR